MGRLTFDEMEDEVRFGLGGRSSTSPSVTSPRVQRWLNQVYLQVTMPSVLARLGGLSGMYRHPNLEVDHEITLVTDALSYSLASGAPATWDNFYQVYAVTYFDTTGSVTISTGTAVPTDRHKKLDPTTFRNIVERSVWPTGEPTRWTRWRGVLYVDRRPSSSQAGKKLLVHGYVRPAEVTDPASKTLIEPEWDDIIVQGTIWRAWDRLNQPDLAENAREEFSRMVNAVVDLHEADAEDWNHEMGFEGHDQSMMEGG